MAMNSAETHIQRLNLLYIIGTYPLLTTTFIDREIRLLQQQGAQLQVISVRRPKGPLSPEQELMQRSVIYLLPLALWTLVVSHGWFALSRPLAYWGTLFYLLTQPHASFKSRLKTAVHFGEGVYAAYIARNLPCDHVHAHFVDRATTIALVLGRLLDKPYSATAHANDIYVNPSLIPAKLSEAKFIATCTAYNEAYLSSTNGFESSSKLHCIYHGLDIASYEPAQNVLAKNNSYEWAPRPSSPILLLSVGQLKEKKGFLYLLQACRILKNQGIPFHCEIVGEGPQADILIDQINFLDLNEEVTLCGALSHDEVIEKYAKADIFVLPCVMGSDGDRDGIPNVILEAMAMELPVVSTRHSGIPEVIQSGYNGRLVPPSDAFALAEALQELINHPHVRSRYGRFGRQTIINSFSVEANVNRLLEQFIA